LQPVSLSKSEQKEEWFLKINPNGRIPAIVDHDNNDYAVFESGAEMMYLAEKAGKLYPQDFNKRHEVNQWLFFLNAGVGPMQGQANHFVRFAPEKIEYAINRYRNETIRLWGVLEERLTDHEWLAADEFTIAGALTQQLCKLFIPAS
jgi:glutathione S-transferase